uniref:DASH complex subunit DAD1 n=1 Tax=Steinernema glaseri TaxID=37863 RepID=A0A1I7YAG4_9BILA
MGSSSKDKPSSTGSQDILQRSLEMLERNQANLERSVLNLEASLANLEQSLTIEHTISRLIDSQEELWWMLTTPPPVAIPNPDLPADDP